MKPIDLHDLQTYELRSRPSQVFAQDLGRPVAADAAVGDWIESLPRQLAGANLRRVRDHLVRAKEDGRPVVAALGGPVIKTGCAPYLIDWVRQGLVTAVALDGAAALHDLELALVGKTGEDVAVTLPTGQFGMARETADAFAVAARLGAEHECGLGRGLGQYLAEASCDHPGCSLLLAAHRAEIPCTVHVAVGTDAVHMHPHVSGAALGEASHTDFRKACAVVAAMAGGVWLNLGGAALLPAVMLQAVSVCRNLGHSLDGLVTVTIDTESHDRGTGRPADEGIEIVGHHEIVIPLLHAAVACRAAVRQAEAGPVKQAA